MEEDIKTITYNDSLERLIADEGERTQGLSWLHNHASLYFQKINTYLALPIVILSTLSGAISASSTSIFIDIKGASLGIGALSLFVGALSTIQSYFGFAKRAENHRICGVTYSKLNHFITIEMALPRKERMNAHDLLKIVRDQTSRLLETAPPVPEHIIKQFQDKFIEKYPNIAIPDIANGLRAIHLAPVIHTAISIKSPVDEIRPSISFFSENNKIPSLPQTPRLDSAYPGASKI